MNSDQRSTVESLAPVPDWLAELCLSQGLAFLPGTDETWVSVEVIAAITQQEPNSVRKKAKGLPRHPRFPSFVRMSDFQRTEGQ